MFTVLLSNTGHISGPMDVIADPKRNWISDRNELIIHILYEGIYLNCRWLIIPYKPVNILCTEFGLCWSYLLPPFIHLIPEKDIVDTLEKLPSSNCFKRCISFSVSLCVYDAVNMSLFFPVILLLVMRPFWTNYGCYVQWERNKDL